MIKLKELIKEECHCGDSCCSTQVNEEVNPRVKKQASSLLKRYERNWKKLEKETEMLMKFANKNARGSEMAFNFEQVLKKLKGNVWDYVRYQIDKPMDDYFYESVNEEVIKEMRVSADLTKIDNMYGATAPRGTTSKTPVTPKAYNMLSKDVKVLKMAVKQLENAVRKQNDVELKDDIVYLVLKAHEALEDMQK